MADNVFTLPDDMIATFLIEEEDMYGNPVPAGTGAGAPTASSSDPAILDFTIDADGHAAMKSPGGKLSTAQATVTIPQASGEPIVVIQNVEVVAGRAVKAGLRPLGLTPIGTTPTPTPTPTTTTTEIPPTEVPPTEVPAGP